jgi:RecA-family ATPase
VTKALPAPASLTVQRRRRATHKELMAAVHPPTPWAVTDLIAPGLTLLAAPPKAGKSYFVLQMGLCVAAGRPFLARQTKKQKVVYFNLEEWENMLQPRAIDICRENRIVDPDIEYIFDMDVADDETFLHEAQREIDAGAGLLIIDLLARVRDELREDAKKNAYARDYNALKQIADFILQNNPGVCIVIVHHTNKGNHEDWQDKISGSQGLAGASHCNIVLHSLDKRGVDDDTRKKMLEYRHLGVAGKQVRGQELMVKMMPNGGGWAFTEETEEDVKNYGTHAMILQILREANGAWVTAKEVYTAQAGNGTLSSVKKMLVRMAQRGEIVSAGSGGQGYCIPVR